LQLTIEKLIYGGDGLAHAPAAEQGGGKAVFLPFVLAGERVQAQVLEEKPGFLRALPAAILEPSSTRTEPQCPYFGQCGGCHYQHAAYPHQLDIKAAILHETIQRIARIEAPTVVAHASPPWHYRNRTRLKIQGGDRFALGYFRFASHHLLPVEQCPLSSPLINRAIAAAWELGRAHLLDSVEEVEFFSNATDDQLLVELNLRPPAAGLRGGSSGRLPNLAQALRQSLPETAGIAVVETADKGGKRARAPRRPPALAGAQQLLYRTGSGDYRVSAGSFFQTNRHLIDDLVQLVTGGECGERAVDLYAGTGLFSLPLAQKFRQLTAVESSPSSFGDLKRNVPVGVTACRQRVEDFLKLPSPAAVDLVVVDPPRSGLGAEAATSLSRFPSSRITYVSCDPATLARDLKTLAAAGFRLQEVHLLDLFPQTFHLESVTKLMR
jgi:23S rRNA (uracil1939-C5)-methyltransferase